MVGCAVGLRVAVAWRVAVGRAVGGDGAVVAEGRLVGGRVTSTVAVGSWVNWTGVGIFPSAFEEVGMLVRICATWVAILSSSDMVGVARSIRPQPASSPAAVRMVRICFISISLLVRNRARMARQVQDANLSGKVPSPAQLIVQAL